jgi:molecular chaperone GrpE
MTDEQTPVTVDGGAPPSTADAHAQTSPPDAAAPDAAAPVDDDPGVGEETVDLAALQTRAAERDEYLALAQRTRADLDNYRKRVTRDAAGAQDRATVRVVRELLPAIDNLGRALAAASAHESTAGDESTTLAAGMRLVQSELLSAFTRVGVESYTPVGEPFDPSLHEAIAQHHVPGAEPGTVVEVYQSGYRLDGNVIRPARVVVAGEPAPGDPQGS